MKSKEFVRVSFKQPKLQFETIDQLLDDSSDQQAMALINTHQKDEEFERKILFP